MYTEHGNIYAKFTVVALKVAGHTEDYGMIEASNVFVVLFYKKKLEPL